VVVGYDRSRVEVVDDFRQGLRTGSLDGGAGPVASMPHGHEFTCQNTYIELSLGQLAASILSAEQTHAYGVRRIL